MSMIVSDDNTLCSHIRICFNQILAEALLCLKSQSRKKIEHQ